MTKKKRKNGRHLSTNDKLKTLLIGNSNINQLYITQMKALENFR